MLEIILVVFLAKKLGALAVKKGEPKGRWQTFFVLSWIGLEVLGMGIGMVLSNNYVLAMLLGLAAAGGSYLLFKYKLDQMPDKLEMDNWVDNIGQNEM